MNQIKAVLFDMDGTLIDARDWHFEALNDALSIFGFTISQALHNNTFNGLSTKKKLELLTAREGFPSDLHEIVYNIKQNRTLRIAAMRCFPIVSIQILLSRLKLKGIKLGVVTNSINETAEYMLKYSGIYDFFDIIVTNENVSQQKPSPEGYIFAMQKLHVTPMETIVIEDGAYGIESARAAGVGKVIEIKSPADVEIQLLISEIGGDSVGL